jgi:hypothetical protein
MKLWRHRILAVLMVLGVVPALSAQDGGAYKDLLRRLPDSTNAVVVANVAALRTTLGAAPGTALGSAHITTLPISANRFVLGAQLDVSQRRHLWTIAMAQLGKKITIQDVAQAESEPVEQFVGHAIVPTPRNAYFVELGADILAAYSPASRQMLKAWLAYEKNKQFVTLPAYMLSALSGDDSALMVMAIDLTDSVDPMAIHRGVNASQVLSNLSRPPDYDAVAKTIAKVQSLILTITPGEPLNGELTVNFNTDTKPIRNFAKPLLIETMQKVGLYVQDFDDWKPRLKERSVGIHGPLSLNALRKYGALVKTPAPNPEAANIDAYKASSPADRMLQSSKRYFKNITQLLDDLKIDKAKNVKAMGQWYDKFADQIDNMPILDVDPELVKFAAATASNLRAMGASLQGISIQSGYLQRQKAEGQIYQAPNYGTWNGGYNGYWGPYQTYSGPGLASNVAQWRAGAAGGVTTVNNFEQIRLQQDQLVSQGAQARVALWQQIDDETANMRRTLTLKYKSEF